MRSFALSGWGQPHDALSGLAPDATHGEYAHHDTVEAALHDIAAQAAGHDVILGWSLGGQLAVRAIAAGLLKPKKLVLIATPFQFVRNKKEDIGMPRDTYGLFRENYAADSKRTLRKAWDLIAYKDVREEEVKAALARHDPKKVLAKDWLNWLDLLEMSSCEHLNFENFPPTLLIHGEQDAVVWPEQSRRFAQTLPQTRLEIWEGCGHAPHWHDEEKLRALIKEHVNA